MSNSQIGVLGEKVLAGGEITRAEAVEMMRLPEADITDLLHWANKVREAQKGNRVKFCSIISWRTGGCSEDCAFCTQSSVAEHRHDCVEAGPDDVRRAVAEARQNRAESFGIVTSGCAADLSLINDLREPVRCVAETGNMVPCASLGMLDSETAQTLIDIGIRRYNHNLETSRSFFPSICSTHDYNDRVKTVRVAKEAGLEVCSGGIFGLGESEEDRVDLAFTLKELDVDQVPLNFLDPIPGTPVEKRPPLEPMEILKIIAVFRLILPDKDIKVAGGREANLKEMQSQMFHAGANGAIIGNYLTTRGREPAEDLQMVADLGLTIQ